MDEFKLFKQYTLNISILLLPYDDLLDKIQNEKQSLIRTMQRKAACKEYWESIGGIDFLNKEMKKLFDKYYGTNKNLSTGEEIKINYPKELKDLFDNLSKLPEKYSTDIQEDLLNNFTSVSRAAIPVLRSLHQQTDNKK